tara:strand:- start:981 stop:1238 length:258 start_codon:yes stop_codon:yes gene_type:complete
MNWRSLVVFLITTAVGFFIGKWVAVFISWIAPQYFNIDPGFLSNWFSKKPTLSSNMLGYIIYASTALVMFTLSSILTELLEPDEK